MTTADTAAIVTKPLNLIYKQYLAALLVLLPAGIVFAILFIGTVYFMSRRRLSPRAELEAAIRRKEFVVHYQPIVELETNTCVGAEALVRWKRPDGTLIPPDHFIPLAESTGLILPITDLVCDAVLHELGSLLRSNRGLHIAINVCADDLKTGRIMEVLETKLAGTGINASQIYLEATERGFVDINAVRNTLTRARAAGHPVALDDFGTGYSSLQYLQELQVDLLKIDKSFVDAMGRETATGPVATHIIALAKSLSLSTVAEGVETQAQADQLRQHGVDFVQGWLFSRPLAANDFLAFQKRSNAA